MDQIASTEIFPREGQTVLGTGFCKAPGGKGANQAVQAARLGAEVTMFGKLGCDANGEEMYRACSQAGVFGLRGGSPGGEAGGIRQKQDYCDSRGQHEHHPGGGGISGENHKGV